MKIKVDENLPSEIANDLRALGYDADTVADEHLSGTKDPDLLIRAKHEGRVFITADRGVGNIRKYPPADYPGIIILRPGLFGRSQLRAFALRVLPSVLDREIAGRLILITNTETRVR